MYLGCKPALAPISTAVPGVRRSRPRDRRSPALARWCDTMASSDSPSAAPALPEWKPKHNPWAIALTVTMATFMEVLDTSIANVALPHMAGSLGASQDEATWVLSSYLVANAVILPISGYLATLIGRKRFYMTC